MVRRRIGRRAVTNTSLVTGILAATLSHLPISIAPRDGCSAGDPMCSDSQGILLSATAMVGLPGTSTNGIGPRYEYSISSRCEGLNSQEPGHDELCILSVSSCASNPPERGDGPAVYVFTRLWCSSGSWRLLGHTCWPELVPGPTTPTMDMIENAFHRTPFAQPGVEVQPENNRTMIRLPTYYAMRWSEEGFEPEEIDSLSPANWFGIQVRIKPVFQSVTYDFGDGTSEGPTTDLGGPYPSGTIIKSYQHSGTFNVQVHATLTGQVSLNGSEWIDIPGQADLNGPIVPLEVLTADNRLYLPGT